MIGDSIVKQGLTEICMYVKRVCIESLSIAYFILLQKLYLSTKGILENIRRRVMTSNTGVVYKSLIFTMLWISQQY